MFSFFQTIFDYFEQPQWLWLLLLALPVIWLGRWSMASMDPVRRWVSISLRLLVLLVIVLMLAGLQSVQHHSALSVIAVVDQSESIRRFARPPAASTVANNAPSRRRNNAAGADAKTNVDTWIRNYLQRSAEKDKRDDDRAGLIEYDGKPRVRSPVNEAFTFESPGIEQTEQGTDSASALRLAMAQFPPDTGRRMVWVSDGNDTTTGPNYLTGGMDGEQAGEVLSVAREAAAAGITIDVLPVPYDIDREVVVEALYAPTEAREGQTIPLRAVLRATEPTPGRIFLRHDDEEVVMPGSDGRVGWPITEDDWTQESLDSSQAQSRVGRWVSVKQIDLPITFSGANRFELVFEPDNPDHDSIAANNRAEAFTLVGGKGRVLVVDNVGGASGEILPKALRSRGIELDVLPPDAMPGSMARLQRYDAVILQNVPADLVSTRQQQMLARYVNDLGGGLMMVGGPESFGAGGWANSPVDKILPVSATVPSQKVLPSGALVVVVDRSGSMGSNVGGTSKTQQEIAGEAALLAISTLYPQDLVGVVAFDNSAKLIVQTQLMQDKFPQIAKKVRSMAPGGGTNIYAGMEQAYRQLADVDTADAAIKHVILLTDGHSQGGNYTKLVGQMRKAGITISTIGVGDGHDQQLLSQIANMGGGQYHPVVNPNHLPQVFVKEAKTIRKNLIKEKTFTPQLQNTGSPIMANVRSVPPLRGMVLTGPKDDVRVFMPIVGPEGEPVFAHWQVGLGRAAAFTSDATNRWAVDWLNWDGYADFWARTVRNIARPAASRNIDLITSMQGDALHLRLDAAGAEFGQTDGRRTADFANNLTVHGAIIDPKGATREVTLRQTGPGIYEASVPALEPGNYITELFISTNDGSETRRVTGGASKLPGAELRSFQTNMALLRQVAQITGGRMLNPVAPDPAGMFTRNEEFETVSTRPLWRTLLVILFVLFLLDVASRRVAWDLSATWEWSRMRTSELFGALRPRRVEAGATLSALRSRRKATTSAMQRMADEATDKTPTTDRKKKFEAAEDFVAARDMSQAVGAAGKDDGSSQAAAKRAATLNANKTEKPQGPTTSRLLDARRRARNKLSEEQASDDNQD